MSEETSEPPDINSSPQTNKNPLDVPTETDAEGKNKKPSKQGKFRVKKNSKVSDASGKTSNSNRKQGENEGGLLIKSKTESEKSPSQKSPGYADAASEDSETSSQFYLRESQTDVLEGTVIVTESASNVDFKPESEPEPEFPSVLKTFNPCCCRRKSSRFLRDSCYVMGAVESSAAISIICIFSVFTMTGHQGKIIKFHELNQDFADAVTFLIWLATAFTGIFQVSAASCKLMYMCTLNLVVNGIIIFLVFGFTVMLALYALYPAIPLSLYAIFFVLKIYMSMCTFGLLEQYKGKARIRALGKANDKDKDSRSRVFLYEDQNDNDNEYDYDHDRNSAAKKVLLWNDKT